MESQFKLRTELKRPTRKNSVPLRSREKKLLINKKIGLSDFYTKSNQKLNASMIKDNAENHSENNRRRYPFVGLIILEMHQRLENWLLPKSWFSVSFTILVTTKLINSIKLIANPSSALYAKQKKIHTITVLTSISDEIILNRKIRTDFIKTLAGKFIIEKFIVTEMTKQKYFIGELIHNLFLM
jgi:hypothetical protein